MTSAEGSLPLPEVSRHPPPSVIASQDQRDSRFHGLPTVQSRSPVLSGWRGNIVLRTWAPASGRTEFEPWLCQLRTRTCGKLFELCEPRFPCICFPWLLWQTATTSLVARNNKHSLSHSPEGQKLETSVCRLKPRCQQPTLPLRYHGKCSPLLFQPLVLGEFL